MKDLKEFYRERDMSQITSTIHNSKYIDEEVKNRLLEAISESKEISKEDITILNSLSQSYVTYTLSTYAGRSNDWKRFKKAVLDNEGEFRPELNKLSKSGWKRLFSYAEAEI